MTETPHAKPAPTSAVQQSPSRSERGLMWLLFIGCGVIAGMFVPQNGIRSVASQWLNGAAVASSEVEANVESEPADAHGDSEGVFIVSIAAQETYGVTVDKAKPGVYTQHINCLLYTSPSPRD